MNLLNNVIKDFRNIPDAFAWDGAVPEKRNVSLDFLKIMACFAVITLHCLRKSSGGTVSFHPYLYYACRFAIPVFFMINGFFQLRKPHVSWWYAGKKALLIVAVVLGWISLCNILKLVTGHNIWWPDYWLWFRQGGNFGVFWYFGTLIVIMACLPAFSYVFHHVKLRYAFLSILFVASLLANAFSLYRIYHGNMFFQANIPQTFRMWTWLFYYFVGGQIAITCQNGIPNSIRKTTVYLLLPITAAVVAWQFFLCYHKVRCVNSEYMYDSPLVMFWCVIIMLCVLSHSIPIFLRKTMVELSACGLSAYAIHMTILNLLIKRFDFNSSVMSLVLIAMVLLVCFSMVIVLRRIPVLKHLTHI